MAVNAALQTRTPGTMQGVLLLLPITMAVMGLVVLAPVLPRMQAEYHAVPGVEYLVPLALTAPALCLALLSPVAGLICDFSGRRRSLIIALVLYAIVGVLPMFLSSLGAIIIARMLLGCIEAVIVTASTTLIGDYFSGRDREKWLAYQTALASASAVALFAIGGALGTLGWRAPFAVYALSLLLAAALALWTWEPAAPATSQAPVAMRFPWSTVLPTCAIAVFGGIMFFTLQIQLSYLLTDTFHVQSSARIGALTAIGSLSVPLGSFAFRRAARFPVSLQLLLAFALIGLSFVLMGRAQSVPGLMVWVVINQFGCGMLLPTLVVWIMGKLPFEIRGRGTGIFMMSWWIGQFLCPQVATVVGKQIGGLVPTLAAFGWSCLVAAALALVSLLLGRQAASAQTSRRNGS
jgi:MFS family permease